jgi:hypothetical protein
MHPDSLAWDISKPEAEAIRREQTREQNVSSVNYESLLGPDAICDVAMALGCVTRGVLPILCGPK